MPANRLDDALDGMSARDLTALQDRIAKRLRLCAACGGDGALNVSGRTRLRGSDHKFSIPLCPKCIEAHRLPETAAGG